MAHVLLAHQTMTFILHEPALAYGPGDDDVTILNDEEILDDGDDMPLSVLDPEMAHDDAC